MALQSIEVPDSIKQITMPKQAETLIDDANRRIESFMLSGQAVIENFVRCDFQLFDQALSWIQQNHLLTGSRFIELGSGFGVATMLATMSGMESVGVEIEPRLVEQSANLADDLHIDAQFYCGSFVPRNVEDLAELATEVENVDTQEGDVYHEIGLEMDDFDLFFAFPWPGEHTFFEAIFDARAANGALLLTYRGRDGMNLVRKI
ncbi:MAG: hypothetical protein VB878_00830 [Pirellulaceae bacterium]